MLDRLRRRHQAAPSPGVTAWSLVLLLLPLMACSGSVAMNEIADEAAQGDLIARLPANSTTLGFIDFAAVRQSALYEFLRQEGASLDPEELQEMLQATGIDPNADLHHVAFVSSSAPSEGLDGSGGAILVATFDRDRVLESLAGMPTEEHAGVTLYALGMDEPEDAEEDEDPDDPVSVDIRMPEGFLAILDESSIAIGDGNTIRAIIDVAGGAPSVRTNAPLMALYEDVDPGSETWVVSAQDAIFDDIGPGGDTPMAQIPIDRIHAMIISVRLSDGINLQFRGRTDEEADAKLLGDSLMGMLAFGKMMLQNSEPEVFAILDRALSAGSSGRDVTVRASLTLDDLNTLRDFARRTFEDEAAQIGG